MGNLISCCIHVQVRAYGIGRLDPQYAKRCLSCGARQYTNQHSCRFCGGEVRMVSQSVGVSHPLPVIMAVDPETGRLGEFTMDNRGILHPLHRREARHQWTPDQSGNDVSSRAKQAEAEEEEEDGEAIDLPLVNAIETDAVLLAVARLADLVDPDRKVSNVPIVYDDASVGLSLTEHSRGESSVDPTTRTEDIKEALHQAIEVVQCPVCLAEYSSPTTLPCGHTLCKAHIFEIERKCPICREGVPKGLYRGSDRRNETLESYTKAVDVLASLAEQELRISEVSSSEAQA